MPLFGKKEREGEKGHKAADTTRDTINEVRGAGEDARKDVNAFADNLVGGNKEHGGTDIHPDAQRVRDEFKDAGNAAKDRFDETTNDKDKKKQGGWFGGSSNKKGNRKSWFGGSEKEKKSGGSWFGGSKDKESGIIR